MILRNIQNNLENYSQKEFLLYANYIIGKAFYFLDSKENATACFSCVEDISKKMIASSKYKFHSTLIIYCAVDTIICLMILENKKENFEFLILNGRFLFQKYSLDPGFLLYFKNIMSTSYMQFSDNNSVFEKELEIIEKIKFNDDKDSWFRYFRSLTIYQENQLLLLLQQEKTNEAKELIENLIRDWIVFDRKNEENEKSLVLMDDYAELRQISIQESYRFFCEVSWFHEKIIFQFLKHGYVNNARALLLRLKNYYSRKTTIERYFIKNFPDKYHFVIPNGENYIDLYNLLSFVGFSLDLSEEGFDYLTKAYDLCEKIWINDLQPKRLEKLLINLTFAMSQSYHLQGHFQQALKILLNKKNLFERKESEITDIYYNIIILLRIKNFQYNETLELIELLSKKYTEIFKNTSNFEETIKILKMEIYRIEIFFEKGCLEEGETNLLALMKKINEIYKDKEHKLTLEKDFEFKKNYQKVIAKYYFFIQNYEKSIYHIQKSYKISKYIHGKNSMFTEEINNFLVETLLLNEEYEEAYRIFNENDEDDNNKNKILLVENLGLAAAFRKKTKAKLLLRDDPEKALEELDICLNILGERTLQNDNIQSILRKETSIVSNDEKKNHIFFLGEIMLIRAKAFFIIENKEERENSLKKALSLFKDKLTDQKFKHPLLIEILLEIIRERMMRYKINEYFQIIKGLESFLPEEKTLFIEMFNHKNDEIRMMKIFEKFSKEKNREALKGALRKIIQEKDDEEKKNYLQNRQYKSYLINRKSEIIETKEFIKKVNLMCSLIFKNYKENAFYQESIKLLKLSQDL